MITYSNTAYDARKICWMHIVSSLKNAATKNWSESTFLFVFSSHGNNNKKMSKLRSSTKELVFGILLKCQGSTKTLSKRYNFIWSTMIFSWLHWIQNDSMLQISKIKTIQHRLEKMLPKIDRYLLREFRIINTSEMKIISIAFSYVDAINSHSAIMYSVFLCTFWCAIRFCRWFMRDHL